MKVTKEINSLGTTELTQCAVLHFAEKMANCPAHAARMRRLAMLIDKQIKVCR